MNDSMIDRKLRDKGALLLECLLAKGISNHQLDSEWPEKSPDAGIGAIGEQIWCYYDDFPEKILTRADFEPSEMAVIERCLVFLRSDREYEWPRYSFETQNVKWYR